MELSVNKLSKIGCCNCGVLIDPNPLNACSDCIKTKIDITEDISKQAILQFCHKCDRYLQPPNAWIKASFESRELLSICLKRIKGLNKVNLIDSGFMWTEPHSKRLKVRLNVQKEVSGAQLEQNVIVEFTIVNHVCNDCKRVAAKDFWNAVVQVRQRVSHKKTFYFLEQLILKSKMHENTVQIKQTKDGIDFFYATNQDARKMIDFLDSVVPCRWNASQQVISQDFKSNTCNCKYTYSVEIVPICKDDIVCLPQKISRENFNIGPICVCLKVARVLHMIDPRNLKTIEIDANTYWRYPFPSICGAKQLREYHVIEVEKSDKYRKGASSKELLTSKYQLADVWIIKESEMFKGGQQLHTKTHLGHLLNPGDTCLGFDLANANFNDPFLQSMDIEDLPDVILVKKVYKDREKNRNWKLKHIDMDKSDETVNVEQKDYQDFLDDIEDDVKLRECVTIDNEPDSADGKKDQNLAKMVT